MRYDIIVRAYIDWNGIQKGYYNLLGPMNIDGLMKARLKAIDVLKDKPRAEAYICRHTNSTMNIEKIFDRHEEIIMHNWDKSGKKMIGYASHREDSDKRYASNDKKGNRV